LSHLNCRASPASFLGAATLRSERADTLFIEAAADRVRAVICRDPHHTLDAVAVKLCVPTQELRALIDDKGSSSGLDFVLDVLAALVHEYAIDPKWLLTGQYDGEMHRQALLLGEDRRRAGRQNIRDFVQAQYEKSREKRLYLSLPPTLEALREKVVSLLGPR
jgi:hypothetical protein